MNQSLTGNITQDGKLRILNKRLFDEFLLKHSGDNVIIEITITEPKSSKGMISYFHFVVVPDIQKALYKLGDINTKEQVKNFIKASCPLMVKEQLNINTESYTSELRSLTDLTIEELKQFLSWLKQWAMENLGVFVKDPETV